MKLVEVRINTGNALKEERRKKIKQEVDLEDEGKSYKENRCEKKE